jgi:hypothetical protein
MQSEPNIPLWRRTSSIALFGGGGGGGVAAIYLLTEHTAHVTGALPYLLLLACPLMHLFMHHGHGSHQQHHDDSS